MKSFFDIARNILAIFGLLFFISLFTAPSKDKVLSPVLLPDAVEARVGVALNKYREEIDLSILMEDDLICGLADDRLIDMQETFSHDAFTKRTNKIREEYHEETGEGIGFGENLYAGSMEDPQKIFDGWIDSPTHREIIEKEEWDNACLKCDDNFCVLEFVDY